MEAIKERLAIYAARTGASKRDVAKHLGISLQTLYNKLRGESEFTLAQAFALADLMGCSVDDLRRRPT